MEPTVQTAIEVALSAAGAIDTAVSSLVSTTGITVNADGSISGVREAVDTFKASKPHFFKASVAQMNAADYRGHRAQTLADLRKARGSVDLPAPSVPVAEMDRRSYDKHRRATISTLARRGRK